MEAEPNIQDVVKAQEMQEEQRVYEEEEEMESIQVDVSPEDVAADDSEHRCDLCKRNYACGQTLAKHIKYTHDPNVSQFRQDKKVQCAECKLILSDKHSLQRHVQRIHIGRTPEEKEKQKTQCLLCHISLSNKDSLRRHMKRQHAVLEPTSNQNCINSESDTFQMEQNREENSDEKAEESLEDIENNNAKCYQCGLCGVKATSKWSLDRHMKYQHDEKGSLFRELDRVRCDFCSANFANKGSLSRHVRFMHKSTTEVQEIEQVQCVWCFDKFPSNKLLNQHIVSQHLRAQDSEDADGSDPKEPENEDSNDPQMEVARYKCEECDLTYASNASLLRHNRIHHNENWEKDVAPFKCEECDLTYGSNSSLLRHNRSHHNENREKDATQFKCEECDLTYASNSSLLRHNRSHHDEKGEMGSLCPICDMPLYNSQSLKRHISSFHSEKKDHQCNLCSAEFSREDFLSNHLKNVHGLVGEIQSNESKSQLQNDEDSAADKNDTIEDVHGSTPQHKGSSAAAIEMETELGKDDRSVEEIAQVEHCKAERRDNMYFCRICPYKCQTSSGFGKHMKYQHDPNAAKYKEEEKVVCRLCHRNLSNRSSLKKHMRRVHNENQIPDGRKTEGSFTTEDEAMLCWPCNILFPSSQVWKTHVIHVHCTTQR